MRRALSVSGGELTLMEERYARNFPTLTPEEQARLRQSRVLLAGCGGLGGYLLEMLLRAGLGEITAADADGFEASDLNRQMLCTAETLGQRKAAAAGERARTLRPDVRFHGFDGVLDAESAPALLRECDLALDALDSAAARLVLADACAAAGVPLVHGAVSMLCAQVAVVPPGSGLLHRLYGAAEPSGEKSVLAPTCALCAAVQAAEAVKLLAGRPSALAGKLLWMDLETMEFRTVEM